MTLADDKRARFPIIAALVFFAAFVGVIIRTPVPGFFLSDSDAGHQLAGARQIAMGEHPFIDFRSTYGPLTFYASYVAQKLGGGTIAAELLLCTIAYSTAFLLLFLSARQMGGTPIALLCTAIALIQLPRFYKYYIFLGAALMLLCLFQYIRKPSVGRLALLAIAVVIAGLYRPDQGAYAFLAAMTAVFVVGKSRIRAMLELPAMMIAAASPWLLFLIARRGLKKYILDSTVGAAHHAAGLNLPFPRIDFSRPLGTGPNLSAISYFIWWMMPVVGAIALVAGWRRLDRQMRCMAGVTIVYAALSLLQSAHRSDHGHLIQAILPCYVLAAFVAGVILRSEYAGGLWKIPALAAMGIALGVSVWAGLVEHSSGQIDPQIIHDFTYFYVHRPATYLTRLRTAQPNLSYFKVIDFIDSHSAEKQRILALPFMTMLYYLTDRPFAGGQMLMAPGYFSDSADQEQMIWTLAEQGNPLIVEVADGGGYDGLPARKTRAYEPIFYRYVDANYLKVSGPPLPDGMDAFIAR